MTTIIALLTIALIGMIATGVYLHYRPLESARARRLFMPTLVINIAVFFGAQLMIAIVGVNDALAAPEVQAAVSGGEIAYPVNECTIAGNLHDMLASIVPANDARAYLSRVVPSLLVEGLTIAGN